MISRLSGSLVEKDIGHVVVDTQGVGYEAFISVRTLETLPATGENVTLWIHTNVREDAIDLYGFAGKSEREMFRKLIGVSGVGARTALAALSHYSPTELQAAIVQGDDKALSRVSGIGKKTAQRIILDLAEKLTGLDIGQTKSSPGTVLSTSWSQLELALTELGYKPAPLNRAIDRLREQLPDETDVQVLLREALRLLRS